MRRPDKERNMTTNDKDYIVGNKFREIADYYTIRRLVEHQYVWEVNADPMPTHDNIVIYCEQLHWEKTLKIISERPSQRFILITHNTDDPITPVKLPDNLKRWFAINVEFKHDKIIPIPIGLENYCIAPYKEELLARIPEPCSRRLNRAYAGFHITHHTRTPIQELIENNKICASWSPTSRYDEYINHLKVFAFCLCPAGNGTDTHRIWEALYSGCIPIVKKHHTHSTISDLPIMFVEDWKEVTAENLFRTRNELKIKERSFNLEKLTFKFWENLINKERST